MIKLEGVPQLNTWRGPARVWALGFCASVVLGLCVSILMVFFDSGLRPQDLGTRFAGPESDRVFPHTMRSLLQTTHTHLYTIAFLEFLLGGLFLLSSASNKIKTFLICIVWSAFALDHAGMWLVFQFGKSRVWMLMLGGTTISVSLFAQVGWCLKDLAWPRT